MKLKKIISCLVLLCSTLTVSGCSAVSDISSAVLSGLTNSCVGCVGRLWDRADASVSYEYQGFVYYKEGNSYSVYKLTEPQDQEILVRTLRGSN